MMAGISKDKPLTGPNMLNSSAFYLLKEFVKDARQDKDAGR